jgi:hypothetical protein
VTTLGLVGVGLHRSLAKGLTSSNVWDVEFFDRLNQGVQATADSLPCGSAFRRSLHDWPRIGLPPASLLLVPAGECHGQHQVIVAPLPARHRKCRDPLGRSRGGFSTKVHLCAKGEGKLLTLLLTPGQRHEAIVFAQLMAGGAVKRRGQGRPKPRPHRLVGERAYSSRQIRQYVRPHGIRTSSHGSLMNIAPEPSTGPAIANGTRLSG